MNNNYELKIDNIDFEILGKGMLYIDVFSNSPYVYFVGDRWSFITAIYENQEVPYFTEEKDEFKFFNFPIRLSDSYTNVDMFANLSLKMENKIELKGIKITYLQAKWEEPFKIIELTEGLDF